MKILIVSAILGLVTGVMLSKDKEYTLDHNTNFYDGCIIKILDTADTTEGTIAFTTIENCSNTYFERFGKNHKLAEMFPLNKLKEKK